MNTENFINSKKYTFRHITFSKNLKTPSEFDYSSLLTDNHACELISEIHTRLLYLQGKYDSIKLKDISEEDKKYLIDRTNFYLSSAAENLSDELITYIKDKPQEHYFGNAMTRLEQIFKIRQMLIIYVFSPASPHYRYLHINFA